MDGGALPTQLDIDIAVVLYAHHSPLAPDAPPQSPRLPHPSTISRPSSAPFAPVTAPLFLKTIDAINALLHNLKYPPLSRTAAMHGCTDAGTPSASSCASSTSDVWPHVQILRHYEAFSFTEYGHTPGMKVVSGPGPLDIFGLLSPCKSSGSPTDPAWATSKCSPRRPARD